MFSVRFRYSFLNYILLPGLIFVAVHSGFAQDREPGPKPGKPPGQGGGTPPNPRPNPRPEPKPEPKPEPRPNPPSPNPAPTPNPTPPPDTKAAYQAGRTDGTPDGRLEGIDRGRLEGTESGLREGEKEGFQHCAREESERAYNRGYREGYDVGDQEGSYAGRQQGRDNGLRDGESKGYQDGYNRADTQAREAAWPLGWALGLEQAQSSDATERGRNDGWARGEVDARADAVARDYPAGRQQYREERYSEDPRFRDEFSNLIEALSQEPNEGPVKRIKPPPAFGMMSLGLSSDSGFSEEIEILNHAEPRWTRLNFRRSYPTPQEKEAYERGYRESYTLGFRSEYNEQYRNAYRDAEKEGARRGCDEARRRSYRHERDRGEREGRDHGYREGYNRVYSGAYRESYDLAYPQAFDRAFRENYQTRYDFHHEDARSRAYAQRTNELYNASFASARDENYALKFPGFAAEENARGRRDEAREFELKPLRLLGVRVQEEFSNGVLEPGEKLRLNLDLRNFSEIELTNQDILFEIEPSNQERVTLIQPKAGSLRNLRPLSQTRILNALEWRFNENAAEKTTQFVFRVYYKGKEVASERLDLTAKYQLKVGVQGTFEFKEGLPTQLGLRIKNQSQVEVPAGTRVKFLAAEGFFEIPSDTVLLPVLAPGQIHEVAFTVITRKASPNRAIPMAFTVTENQRGRKIGMLDATGEIPISNDYRIELRGDSSQLKTPGITRLEYKLRNVSSRLLMRSLQLHIKAYGSGGELLTAQAIGVMGPNPQYMNPLNRGGELQFVVPLRVRAPGSVGYIDLDVREDGVPVVIHRLNVQSGMRF